MGKITASEVECVTLAMRRANPFASREIILLKVNEWFIKQWFDGTYEDLEVSHEPLPDHVWQDVQAYHARGLSRLPLVDVV